MSVGRRRDIRLCIRGRGQGKLHKLPRAAAEAGAGGRSHRLRQHPVVRHRGVGR